MRPADAPLSSDVPPPPDVPVTRCVSSRMCPGQVCDTTRGLCVDCLTAMDCTGGQRCVGDRCVAPPPTCRSDRDCSSRNQVCNLGRMECADCVTDRDCGAGQYCDPDGACRAQVCTPNAVTCADATTRSVCSANGDRSVSTPCPTGPNATPTCGAGACAIRCETGFADCDNDPVTGCEVNLRTSGANCGACGLRCGDGQMCSNGMCLAGACATGQTRCGAVCLDLQTDRANCGTCGRACTVDQVCAGGTCGPRSCPGGQTSCGGACVDTSSNTQHCGGCGRMCTLPLCLLGMCVGGPTCGTGLTACGMSCANLQNDPANCGRCGVTCPAGQTCAAAACTASTPLRFSLTWSGTADMDLWVYTPGRTTLSYRTPMVGGGAHSGDSTTTGPEEATWSAAPPAGTYVMCAIPFRITGSTTVRYTIYRNGVAATTGTRTYATSAPSDTACAPGSMYEVARITL